MNLKSPTNNKYRSKNDIALEIMRDGDGYQDGFPSIEPPPVLNWEKQFRQAETVRKQEMVIFSNKEKETKVQVQKLQGELVKLAKAVTNLSEEIKVATIQTIVDPGTYHLNFLEKLISVVKLLTKQVEDATSWSSMGLARGKKKSHYWGQVRKSGSKFLLSQERYMSTQAG